MTLDDLDGVAELHRQCFATSASFLSGLGHDIVKRSYAQAVEEEETIAVVLEKPETGRIVGLAIGTITLGFTRRFVQRHLFRFSLSLLKGLLADAEVRKEAWGKVRDTRRLTNRAENALANAGVAAPKGPEAFFLVIGVHAEWRGGGNAERLVEYLTARMWEKGMARVRGSVSASNLASLILYKDLGWSMKRVSDEQVFVWTDRPTGNDQLSRA